MYICSIAVALLSLLLVIGSAGAEDVDHGTHGDTRGALRPKATPRLPDGSCQKKAHEVPSDEIAVKTRYDALRSQGHRGHGAYQTDPQRGQCHRASDAVPLP